MPLTYQVRPGARVDLKDYDPRYDDGLNKADGEPRLESLARELDELQELLYGAGTHSLLVILQGMDTSGKDGTIRGVFSKVSPLGSSVASFKVPTAVELAHDFLWRVHQATPPLGHITIFNRSHYEDVLVVRVHKLVPEAVWKLRYRQINDFERLLAENNTILLKFFLHISKEEQEERLLAREQEVAKSWKLAAGDWKERAHWDDYQSAYEDALRECSTEHAPWHIVPADKKWFRNFAVASTIIAALQPYKAGWMEKLAREGVERRRELEEMRHGASTD